MIKFGKNLGKTKRRSLMELERIKELTQNRYKYGNDFEKNRG